MAVFSGFYESHGPTPPGDVRGIVPAHHHGHQNGQQRGGYFASSFSLLSLWWPPVRYGVSSRLMAAFSGFIKALDLLHQAMLVVLHCRTAMAIEMASNGGTFFAVAASFV
jgi:hypothetical protein